jgi:hypothetical protein
MILTPLTLIYPCPPGTTAPAGLNIHPLALLYNPGHFTTNNTATTTTTTATTASTTTTDTTTNTASTNTTTSDTSTSDTTYNNTYSYNSTTYTNTTREKCSFRDRCLLSYVCIHTKNNTYINATYKKTMYNYTLDINNTYNNCTYEYCTHNNAIILTLYAARHEC